MAVTQIPGSQIAPLALTTEVSGILPIANGGTATGTATGTGNLVLATTPTIDRPSINNLGGQSAIVAASAAINTTETVLTSITVPAWNVGTSFRIVLLGTTTASAANVSTFTLRAGTLGTTADTSLAAPTVTSAATGTINPFCVEIYFTVRTTGIAATTAGSLVVINQGVAGIAATATAVTAFTGSLNTTTATKLTLTYKSAAVTTTTTFQNAIIEIVKP